MLYQHVDPAFLHVYAKTQPTASSTFPVIGKYVPERNITIPLDIDAKYSHAEMEDVNAHMYHINHVH